MSNTYPNGNLTYPNISGAGGGGGSGTVTIVSVVQANGLKATVANPTTTPAITLNTSDPISFIPASVGLTISGGISTFNCDYLSVGKLTVGNISLSQAGGAFSSINGNTYLYDASNLLPLPSQNVPCAVTSTALDLTISNKTSTQSGAEPYQILSVAVSGVQYTLVGDYAGNIDVYSVSAGIPTFLSSYATGGQTGGICSWVDTGFTWIAAIDIGSPSQFNVWIFSGGVLTPVGMPVTVGNGGIWIFSYVEGSINYLVTPNTSDNTFSVFSVISGTVTQIGVATATNSGPQGATFWVDSGIQYMALVESGNNTFQVYSMLAGVPTPIGGPIGTGSGPYWICNFTYGGTIYLTVTNPGDATVSLYTVSVGVATQVLNSPYSVTYNFKYIVPFFFDGIQGFALSDNAAADVECLQFNGTDLIPLGSLVTISGPSGLNQICQFQQGGEQYFSVTGNDNTLNTLNLVSLNVTENNAVIDTTGRIMLPTVSNSTQLSISFAYV